jgi:hypothetical protein
MEFRSEINAEVSARMHQYETDAQDAVVRALDRSKQAKANAKGGSARQRLVTMEVRKALTARLAQKKAVMEYKLTRALEIVDDQFEVQTLSLDDLISKLWGANLVKGALAKTRARLAKKLAKKKEGEEEDGEGKGGETKSKPGEPRTDRARLMQGR